MRQRQRVHGGIVYRSLSTAAILGIFLAVGILTFSFAGFLRMSTATVGVVLSIAVVCLGLLMSLVWVRKLENGVLKTTSIVFLSIIGFCALLWLAAIWMFIIMLYNVENVTDSQIAGLSIFAKISVLLSLQLLVASFVANQIVRFKATFLPFQVISDASYLFVDFYVSFALLCIKIRVVTSDIFSVSEDIGFLGSKLMITLIVMGCVFIGVSNGIIRAITNNRIRRTADYIAEEETQEVEDAIQKKMALLESLHDRGVVDDATYEKEKTNMFRGL